MIRQLRGAVWVCMGEVEAGADGSLDARERTDADAGNVGERLAFTRTGMWQSPQRWTPSSIFTRI